MNFHPLFVHFPIALLTVYVVLECIRFSPLLQHPTWIAVKFSMLLLGTLGTIPALVSGSVIEDQFQQPPVRILLETHETWAVMTTILFSVLCVLYLVELLGTYFQLRPTHTLLNNLWKHMRRVQTVCMRPYILLPYIMIAGLAITATGALGGALAYGKDVDPIVSFVYRLLIH